MRFPILSVFELVGVGVSISYPRTMLLFPVVIDSADLNPRAILFDPVVTQYHDLYQNSELFE